MENITIGQVVAILGIIAGLITSISTICVFCKKAINKGFEPIYKKIDNNTLNQDKRFLIQFMDKAERGEEISDEEMRVAFETKTEYNALRWGQLCRYEVG